MNKKEKYDGRSRPTNDLYKKNFDRIFGKKIKKNYLPAGPAGCMRRNSDNTKLEKLTGWKPNYPLELGLKNTYEFIKDQLTKK